jgi:hypothetical protein
VASFPGPGAAAESIQRVPAPEGALSASGADMGAFLSFQLCHGPGTVLSASALAAMHAPVLPADCLHGLAGGSR